MSDKEKSPDAPDTDAEVRKLITSILDPHVRTLAAVMLLTEDIGSQEARLDAIGDAMLIDMMGY